MRRASERDETAIRAIMQRHNTRLYFSSGRIQAWVANEVAYHKTVNGALETTLIPSATNPELKSLLQTGLKIFQGHLEHAEHLAAMLQ